MPARFALAPRRAAIRARRSTQFRYMLSEPATVRLTSRRAMAGRLRGRACAHPTRTLSRLRRCVRQVPAGVVSGTGATGQNTVRFGGWIGRRRLAPGSYRVTLTVTDLDDGHTAAETTARFGILPR